jgi:trimeric autotransporter adhesin
VLERTYELVVNRLPPPRFDPEAYLKPSQTGPGLRFGTSIALSAVSDDVHGYTVAVGAPEEGDGVGAVYVYTRDLGTQEWTQQARLAPADAEHRYNFGRSVALSANGDRLVVGAPGWDLIRELEDDDEAIPGEIHVFTRAVSGEWVVEDRFAAVNAHDQDGFGYSVALAGNTLAVGAPGESSSQPGIQHTDEPLVDPDAEGSGAVYVYTYSAGGDPPWNLQAFVKAPDPQDVLANNAINEWFGWSVALSGDEVDMRLAIGRPGDSSGGVGGNGAVHAYARNGTNWEETQPRLIPHINAMTRAFGWEVALSADGATLAVGVPRQHSRTTGVWNAADGDDQLVLGQAPDADQQTNSGATYVYSHQTGEWVGQAFIKASNSQSQFRFGSGLALSADGDRLVVGAPGESGAATTVDGNQASTGAAGSGAAYAFERGEDLRWVQTAYIKVPNSRAGINFGESIAITADGGLIAGGAPAERSATNAVVMDPGNFPVDNTSLNRGAAYIFREAVLP